MKFQIEHIECILRDLAARCGVTLDHGNFQIMSDCINEEGVREDEKDLVEVTKDYLYKNMHISASTAKENGECEIGLNKMYLEKIIQFLGYKTFEEYIRIKTAEIDPLLLSCVGTYYSYVRRSVVTGAIYQSPVQITEDSGRVWLELRGPDRIFRGELKSGNGCIFCLMEAEDGKHFYHVYRIAAMKSPRLLQGVFSGILTAQEPVAGRTVLIRKEANIHEMRHKEISIEELRSSEDKEKQYLAVYFEDFSKNNLQVNKSITFRIDDLVL